ncbi:MAG TPA: PQQ-dependent sugar dehydrogenase, partial [Gemmatimonadales bacterium]
VSHGDEQGTLGLAFAPDYATSGAFYVHTTDLAGNIRILRFKVSGDPNVADPTSGVEILTFDHPQANHNGGMLAFGNDGYLYIGSGDGGGGGDPLETGQDPSDLLGAILRIDVSGDSAGYAIPGTNPFVGDSGFAPEVWAYGLRNPWRFSFDRQTHDLWIGDVGQGEWEEVDRLPAGVGGQNLGWDDMEGTHCYEPSSGCVRTGKTMPLFDYAHGTDRCSVIGGYVYRGPAVPEIQGMYVYGDLCDGLVRVWNVGAYIATPIGSSIYSFGEDLSGRLYVLTGEGAVLRLSGALIPIG